MRSEVAKRMLNAFDREKYLENNAKKIATYHENLTMEKVIGDFVGIYIFDHYLPTIDILGPTTKRCFQTTKEEREEYERLTELWYKKYSIDPKSAKDEWGNLTNFRKTLVQKYLPKVLTCDVPLLKYDNVDEVKRGIQVSLWNSDCCYYKINNLDDIVIEPFNHSDPNVNGYFTTIVLKLDEDDV